MQQKRRRSYAGSTTLLKELNRSLVLDALRQQGSLSRSELAGLTGLTAATISNIVEELIADGYVKSEGQGESQGGRKPTLLSLVAGARQVVAV
ncbi:MAG TPA: winged helix-turn-helix transcriptional regulator, partial [Firmicutes bacterium]|nr:winged helix-turn-helix transcriptional regulator [Bacillota bacterium]